MPHQRPEGGFAIIPGGGVGIDSAAGEIFCKESAKVALLDQDAVTVKTAEEIRCLVPGAEVAGFVANLAEESAAQIVVDNVLQASPREFPSRARAQRPRSNGDAAAPHYTSQVFCRTI
jgi:2-hydroxycyclohexanecarboxyl-CoA dehydrogenase